LSYLIAELFILFVELFILFWQVLPLPCECVNNAAGVQGVNQDVRFDYDIRFSYLAGTASAN
jgi:hypothetical protein